SGSHGMMESSIRVSLPHGSHLNSPLQYHESLIPEPLTVVRSNSTHFCPQMFPMITPCFSGSVAGTFSRDGINRPGTNAGIGHVLQPYFRSYTLHISAEIPNTNSDFVSNSCMR